MVNKTMRTCQNCGKSFYGTGDYSITNEELEGLNKTIIRRQEEILSRKAMDKENKKKFKQITDSEIKEICGNLESIEFIKDINNKNRIIAKFGICNYERMLEFANKS